MVNHYNGCDQDDTPDFRPIFLIPHFFIDKPKYLFKKYYIFFK